MDDKDKLISRIQKLLALAGNNPSEEEAKRAMEKANKLMTEHQLSMSEVDVEKTKQDRIMEENYVVEGQKMRLLWIVHLAEASARLFDGRTLIRHELHKTRFTFVGYKDDIEAMKAMFEHLYKSWHSIVKTDLIKAKEIHYSFMEPEFDETWAPRDTMKFKAGHGLAYATTIYNRVEVIVAERNKEVTETSVTGKALVVVKDQALTSHMSEYGTAKTSRVSTGSTDGLSAGRAAGNAASLGGAIGNSTKSIR